MKFTVMAALLGLTKGINIQESLSSRQQMADKMKELCRSVKGMDVDQNA